MTTVAETLELAGTALVNAIFTAVEEYQRETGLKVSDIRSISRGQEVNEIRFGTNADYFSMVRLKE